jgi:hypothetical protein
MVEVVNFAPEPEVIHAENEFPYRTSHVGILPLAMPNATLPSPFRSLSILLLTIRRTVWEDTPQGKSGESTLDYSFGS